MFGISGRGIDLDYCDIEWFALEMNQDHSVIFEVAPKYSISDSFDDYEGYSISSMEFSRQEYWSGLPFPSPGDLCNPGIEPRSPTLQVDSLLSEPPGKSQSDVDDSEKVDDDTEAVTKTFGHYQMPGIALNII